MTSIGNGREFDLLVAGHLCLDIIPELATTPRTEAGAFYRPGALVNVGPCSVSTGGPVFNTGLCAVRLGSRVAFSATVGDDAYGRIVRRIAAEYGAEEGIRVQEGVGTSYTIVLAPPGLDRMFLHFSGANDSFGVEDVAFDLVEKAAMFHLGYPPLLEGMWNDGGETLAEIFRQAKACGATTSLDMSLPDPASGSGQAPWREILTRTLPHVDIFLPSVEESLYALDREKHQWLKRAHNGGELVSVIEPAECSAMAAEFLTMGASMVALKAGHRGWYFRTGDAEALSRLGAARPSDPRNWNSRELWCPAFDIERIVSAAGSGDASIAGFLVAYLQGMRIESCLQVANCVGYQNLGALDTTSGIRSWDETQTMLSNAMATVDPQISDPNWRYDEILGMWCGPSDRAVLVK